MGQEAQLRLGTERGQERGHWWRCSFSVICRPKNEGKLCIEVKAQHHKDLWETTGERAAQLQQRRHHFGDAGTMGWPQAQQRQLGSQPEPRRDAVCATLGRAGAVIQALWRSLEDQTWTQALAPSYSYCCSSHSACALVLPSWRRHVN